MPKFIIDTDAGVDDAQAIMMALMTSEVDIIGITAVSGNTDVDNVTRNVLRVFYVAEVPLDKVKHSKKKLNSTSRDISDGQI